MSATIIVIIVVALVFNFLNGIHDSSNIVATTIFSRAINPHAALIMTAAAEFVGPFIFGVAVATTIGSEIVTLEFINLNVLLAALLSAIIWNILTWILGIPSSSLHALLGGIIGAVIVGVGFDVIQIAGVVKVLVSLFVSPLIGFVAGLIIANIIHMLCWKATPRINGVFKKLQIFTSLGLALSHGTNDAQKTMGIIVMALMIGGYQTEFEVPFWVIMICAMAMSAGIGVGGWRLIKTLGAKFYKIRPVHGLASQASSSLVILVASLLGAPVSTTQVVSTSIMGVGAADRVNKVRWGVAGDIFSAWLFTIPSTAVLAAVLYWVFATGAPAVAKLF